MPQDITYMEPMLPPTGNRELEDLALTLATRAGALAGTINPVLQKSVGNLVRSMNCYYSNLIEGHNTHPKDIDAALAQDFSDDIEKRNLQLEAVAHIHVQQKIDNNKFGANITSPDFFTAIHWEFYEHLPPELLWSINPNTKKHLAITPGEIRMTEVQVGKHLPPKAQNLHRFLRRFEEAYMPNRLSKVQQIIAVAASHHRFVWIHPFIDGNGRVVRLFSHAYLQQIGIGSNLWSISRGLARNVMAYKELLASADEPRRGDLDGRGNLSETALTDFCVFFLKCCIDQVDYMAKLLDMREFLGRIERYINDETAARRLPKGSFKLLREAVLAGEFKRGQASEITGYKERQARDVMGALLQEGYLVSDSVRGPVRLGFPVNAIERWLPLLYPMA